MLVKRVLDTIKRHNLIGQGENVVVGVSGGPDSVCLLHVLFSLSRQLQMKLYAVHINHMLRGNEANADERYVEDLCKNLGLGLHTKACDINGISKDEGISLEEAGRNARYREFEEFADSIGGARIAVAHNKKDQAETVLMNIVRGTGLHGLKGMDYSRGRIVRPLLDIERKDIEVYCSLHSLEPRTDATNLLEIYTRNKIRLGLIPYIDRAFDTNLVESLTRMSDLLRDENDFIERTAADFYDRCKVTCTGSVVALDIGKLNAMHIAMIKRVIRCGIKDVKGDLKGIESVHVDDVLKIGLSGNTGSEIHLPGGIRAVNSYGLLKIYIKEETQ